jgi:hypothetical protein
MKYLILGLFVLFVFGDAQAQKAQWRRLDGPYGSPARTIACDSGNTLYAAVEDSLYRSEDGGRLWQRIGFEFKNRKLFEIAGGNDGTLYLAASNGLFLSRDRGEEWSKVPLIDYAQEVQTSSNGLVCVLGIDSTFEIGLFISGDSGNTWAKMITDFTVYDYEHAISVGPKGEIYIIKKTSVHSSESLKLFRSFDRGLSWDTVEVIGQFTIDSATANYSAHEAGSRITHGDSGKLYCTFFVNSGIPYPFTSFDKGITWSLSHDFDKGDSILPGFYHYMTGRQGELYGFDAGGGSGFYNVCLKKNGQLTRLQDPYAYIYATLIDRSGKVFIATETGIYYYITENKLEGAGTNNSKVWRILTDRDGNLITSIYQRTDMRGFGWYNQGYLSYSTDMGVTWSAYSSYTYQSHKFVCDMAQDSLGRVIVAVPEKNKSYYFDPTNLSLSTFPGSGISGDSGLFAIGRSGAIYKSIGYFQNWDIYVSTNEGQNWLEISYGLEQRIYSLCTSVNGFVFAGTANAVYRLKEGDTVWTRCYNQFLGTPVVALHTTREGVLYAGSSSQGVYKSTDDGESWTQINTGLTNLVISSICSDPQGNIYAATRNGVFKRIVSTTVWENITNGISVTDIRDLTVSKQGILYAATNGGGVYQFLSDVNSVYAERAHSITACAKQNPFTNVIVLQVDIKISKMLELEIYDELGKQMHRESLQNIPKGEHRLTINTKDWPIGVYYTRISATGDEAVIVKLIKL